MQRSRVVAMCLLAVVVAVAVGLVVVVPLVFRSGLVASFTVEANADEGGASPFAVVVSQSMFAALCVALVVAAIAIVFRTRR